MACFLFSGRTTGAGASLLAFAGRSCLHQACADGHIEVVRALLAAGADPNIRDADSAAPIHFSACAGDLGVLQLLLDHGADISTTNESGTTALHTVASLHCPDDLQQRVLAHTPDAFLDKKTPLKQA